MTTEPTDAPDEGECAKALREIIRRYEPWAECRELAQEALATHKAAPSESACASVLREIEWIDNGARRKDFCPVCDNDKRNGHAPNCELDAALRGQSTFPITRDCRHHGLLWTVEHWGKDCPICELEKRLDSQPHAAGDDVVRALRECVEAAYMQGHNDTVESRYGDPEEVANDLINVALASAASGGEPDKLSSCPDEYWDPIVKEINNSVRQVRHAHLLNHQAAYLLALAKQTRSQQPPAPRETCRWTYIGAKIWNSTCFCAAESIKSPNCPNCGKPIELAEKEGE